MYPSIYVAIRWLIYLVIGSEEMGVNDLLYTSIRKSDLDLRKTLYQNIVLSGGSTLFKGKDTINLVRNHNNL